jgi:hypothetical protein
VVAFAHAGRVPVQCYGRGCASVNRERGQLTDRRLAVELETSVGRPCIPIPLVPYRGGYGDLRALRCLIVSSGEIRNDQIGRSCWRDRYHDLCRVSARLTCGIYDRQPCRVVAGVVVGMCEGGCDLRDRSAAITKVERIGIDRAT